MEQGILAPGFLQRLRELRARLLRVLRRLEHPLENPKGDERTPEFESHRAYAYGDDPRYIDWNLYARLDRFFVKSTVREKEGAVHVLVDASESMRHPFREKTARGREVAAALAYLALSAGNSVWVTAWADGVVKAHGPFHGEGQTVRVLRTLSRLTEGHGTDLDHTLRNLLRRRGLAGSSAVIISDFIDTSTFSRRVQYLSAQGTRLGAVQVLAPAEVDLRVRGNLQLRDPESGESARLLVGYAASMELRGRMREFLRGTEQFFSRRAARFVRATTDRPFEEVVVDYFLGVRPPPRLGNS